jgi:hypothetical protein
MCKGCNVNVRVYHNVRVYSILPLHIQKLPANAQMLLKSKIFDFNYFCKS